MKILPLILMGSLFAIPAHAAPPPKDAPGLLNKVFISREAPDPEQVEEQDVVVELPPLPEPEYISSKPVKLTDKERKALSMATEWKDRKVNPVMHPGGKVVYVFGATMPSIVCAPLKTSDLELQPGENVNDVIVGDTARWVVTVGRSGHSEGESTHLVFKPLDAGLETTAVITTDRRTYHVRLVSDRKGHTPYVGFVYPEDQQQALREQLRRKERKQKWETTEVAGTPVKLSALDFNYRIVGEAEWKPLQVYNDGLHTVIRLPETVRQNEYPVLLVERAGERTLVNYRVHGTSMVVDGVFRKGLLLTGVGKARTKVEIQRMVEE
ncbi:P-type conjugative transfer protein TrbG [Pseudodesulfovibrio tunisiensis]|uniref:P-type conjugative transfer protein TrbG n=1 Tax=Pseudodesulfovibrio tunisiensis TaxID=463192 RepID=UPI001FB2587D|nr:P-type conjugative transfer protein TrbG [Pseudodesulfovibrio tunisiensis]